MEASRGPRRRQGGHTLVELVTVVALLAVAVGLAAPALGGLRRNQDLEASAFGVAQCLRQAQWRAIVTGRRVRVAAAPHERGGWRLLVEREEGAAWVPCAEERAIPRGIVLAVAGPERKVFNPDGTCSIGSLTLRGPGGFYRCTLAPATGRVRLYRGEREVGRGL